MILPHMTLRLPRPGARCEALLNFEKENTFVQLR